MGSLRRGARVTVRSTVSCVTIAGSGLHPQRAWMAARPVSATVTGAACTAVKAARPAAAKVKMDAKEGIVMSVG